MVNPLKTPFQNEDQFSVDCNNESAVEPQFQINRRRNMPIVKRLGQVGYYVFPSENSYDKFKANGEKFGHLDAEGMGLPLLHMETGTPSFGMVAGCSSVFMIFKFLLFSAKSPPPAIQHELVAQDGQFCLYKVPFCEIYRNGLFQSMSAEYRLVFPFENGPGYNCTMKRSFMNRDMYSFVGDTNLRWHVSASILYNRDHYTLQILDDCVPNLLDDPDLQKKKKAMKKGKKPKNVVIGHYTRTFRDSLPHHYSKRANLYIGERADSSLYGIEGVPWTSQVLACQGLVIQFAEHMRRRSKNNSSGGGGGY